MNQSQRVIVILTCFAIAATMAFAQATPSATRSGVASAQQDQDVAQQAQPVTSTTGDHTWQPDETPVAGALLRGLGFESGSRNSLSYGFDVLQSFDSNSSSGSSGSGWNEISAITGKVGLHRAVQNNTLNLNYSGGLVVSPDVAEFSGYPRLGVADSFVIRRWTLTLADDMFYTPQSRLNAFGGLGGFGGPGFGGSFSGVSGTFLPNQTIYATPASLSNTVTTQVAYGISARSTWTASASYGLVHYVDSGGTGSTVAPIDTKQITLTSGYTRNLSRRSSLGARYSFGSYSFGDSLSVSNSNQTHSAELVYSRSLWGRWTIQGSGGPQVTIIGDQQPVTPFRTGNLLGWTGTGQVSYARARSSYGLQFYHSSNSGGGVLIGATSDIISLSTSRELSREWHGAATMGYAHNAGLVQTATYDTGYLNASISRSIGRSMSAILNYSLQRQHTNAVCIGVGCANDFTRHLITLGFSWRGRDIPLGR